MAQVLKLIEPFELGKGPAAAMNGKALHLIAEAEKLAFADRDAYIGDPDFVPAPAGLLNAGYLDTRRALINPGAAMGRPTPRARRRKRRARSMARTRRSKPPAPAISRSSTATATCWP